MPIPRHDLVAYLDQYLDASRGRDYGPNGLQVEGKDEIRKVVTGVSACHELFVRAREAGADAVLVHHGLFWEGMPRTLTGFQFRRVSEWIMNVAREAGVHYLAAGHYATERLGIRALGEHLAEKFGIEAEFIDVPNPV